MAAAFCFAFDLWHQQLNVVDSQLPSVGAAYRNLRQRLAISAVEHAGVLIAAAIHVFFAPLPQSDHRWKKVGSGLRKFILAIRASIGSRHDAKNASVDKRLQA